MSTEALATETLETADGQMDTEATETSPQEVIDLTKSQHSEMATALALLLEGDLIADEIGFGD